MQLIIQKNRSDLNVNLPAEVKILKFAALLITDVLLAVPGPVEPAGKVTISLKSVDDCCFGTGKSPPATYFFNEPVAIDRDIRV